MGKRKITVCVRKRNGQRGKKGDLKRERGKREMETKQRKEDRHFNNSQTPASFRIESVPKLDPCVLYT